MDYADMVRQLMMQPQPVADVVRGPWGPRGINAIAAPEAGGVRGYAGGANPGQVVRGRFRDSDVSQNPPMPVPNAGYSPTSAEKEFFIKLLGDMGQVIPFKK
jgi:hypothetical protein